MEPVREAWTDERLDDLNGKVDDLARRTDEGLRDLRVEMAMRFDGLQRAMIHGVIALSAATLTGFGGLAALLATQI